MRPLLPSFTLGLTLALAAGAAATPFFYRDDFNGTSLDPGWEVNPGGFEGSSTMTYNVGDGFLRPTGWVQGSNPDNPGGSAGFSRQLLPFGQYIGDFGTPFSVKTRVRVPQRPLFSTFSFGVTSRDQFGMSWPTAGLMRVSPFGVSTSSIRIGQDNSVSPSVIVNITPGHLHEFELRVVGDQLQGLVDGVVVTSRPWQPTFVNRIAVGFQGGSNGTGQGPDVDYVEVVPEPIMLIGFAAAAAKVALSRKSK